MKARLKPIEAQGLVQNKNSSISMPWINNVKSFWEKTERDGIRFSYFYTENGYSKG